MSRPGLVFDAEHSTPPITVWRGEQITGLKFPSGSQLIYGPDARPPLVDPNEAVRNALASPMGAKPLTAQLRAGMKLTIAFQDLSATTLRTQGIDIRQRTIEAVLDRAADAGVDDVCIINARGLNRRMTAPELRSVLGERVLDSFHRNGRLSQHDVDADDLVDVGKLDKQPLQLNARASESDLLVVVSINTDAAPTPTLAGLCGARTLKPGHDVAAITKVIDDKLNCLHIEATLDTNMFVGPEDYLQTREWEWNLRQKATLKTSSTVSATLPASIRHKFARRMRSGQQPSSVSAGSYELVHKASNAIVIEQQGVTVPMTADVVNLGVPSFGRWNVNSLMNPVLMAEAGLVGQLSSVAKQSPAREGGVVILHHPATRAFDPVQQPSYIDFFDEALVQSSNYDDVFTNYFDRFADDAWYRNLYKTSYAMHGTHPFVVWYEIAQVLRSLGGVIVVGGDRVACRRLGFRSATTFFDAMEMARDISKAPDPTISHLHAGPRLVLDVS